jgi:hypothetical protein
MRAKTTATPRAKEITDTTTVGAKAEATATSIPPPRPRALTRPVHARHQARVADQFRRRWEAGDLTDLGREGQRQQRADAGDRAQELHAPIRLGERRQLRLERSDPLVEQLDHRERLGDRGAPDLRQGAHCHIAEHHESGMMFSFNVTPAAAE